MDEAEKIASSACEMFGRHSGPTGWPVQEQQLAALVRSYGAQCRRAGAEAMREAAAALASGWGAMKCSHAIAELPLPSAAEAASPAAGWRVPDGWKLVPITPTEAMIEAGWIDKEDVDSDNIYCAMLDAAPAPSEEARAG